MNDNDSNNGNDLNLNINPGNEFIQQIAEMIKPGLKRDIEKDLVRVKLSFTYQEVADILGCKSKRAVQERVKNPNNHLKAHSRNTRSPAVFKEDLFNHMVKDLGFDPVEAERILYS